MDQTETKADTAYKWIVRACYLAAIGLNLYYLIESQKETPEGRIALAKLQRVRDEILRPWWDRKKFRRMVTEVHLEAWQTVEDAAS